MLLVQGSHFENCCLRGSDQRPEGRTFPSSEQNYKFAVMFLASLKAPRGAPVTEHPTSARMDLEFCICLLNRKSEKMLEQIINGSIYNCPGEQKLLCSHQYANAVNGRRVTDFPSPSSREHTPAQSSAASPSLPFCTHFLAPPLCQVLCWVLDQTCCSMVPPHGIWGGACAGCWKDPNF